MPLPRKKFKHKDNFFYHIPSMSGFPFLKAYQFASLWKT